MGRTCDDGDRRLGKESGKKWRGPRRVSFPFARLKSCPHKSPPIQRLAHFPPPVQAKSCDSTHSLLQFAEGYSILHLRPSKGQAATADEEADHGDEELRLSAPASASSPAPREAERRLGCTLAYPWTRAGSKGNHYRKIHQANHPVVRCSTRDTIDILQSPKLTSPHRTRRSKAAGRRCFKGIAGS